MTYTGPWLTPAPQTSSGGETLVSFPTATLLNSNYAVLCESTFNGAGIGGTSENVGRWEYDGISYTLGQLIVDLDVEGRIPLWAPPLPWPAKAISYETVGVSTMTGLSLTFDVADITTSGAADVHLFLAVNDPATLIFEPINGGRPDGRFIPGASITPLGTQSFPAGATTTTLTGDVPLSAVSAAYPGTGAQVVQAVVGVTEQITHTAPTLGHGRRWSLTDVTITVTYQPPTYRFVYDVVPPLRQYPRDDFLGGAPRQGNVNGSASVQSSTRQGWRNTYR